MRAEIEFYIQPFLFNSNCIINISISHIIIVLNGCIIFHQRDQPSLTTPLPFGTCTFFSSFLITGNAAKKVAYDSSFCPLFLTVPVRIGSLHFLIS